jgi:hypothetical protein
LNSSSRSYDACSSMFLMQPKSSWPLTRQTEALNPRRQVGNHQAVSTVGSSKELRLSDEAVRYPVMCCNLPVMLNRKMSRLPQLSSVIRPCARSVTSSGPQGFSAETAVEQQRRTGSCTSRCSHFFTRFEALYAANHVLHVMQGAVSQQQHETAGRRSPRSANTGHPTSARRAASLRETRCCVFQSTMPELSTTH